MKQDVILFRILGEFCARADGIPELRQAPGTRGLRVDFGRPLWRNIHMKRTNLVLNGELLEETLRLSGERTYSRAVEMAMRTFVQRVKAKRILELAGSGLWEGDLAQMREDRPPYEKKGRRVSR